MVPLHPLQALLALGANHPAAFKQTAARLAPESRAILERAVRGHAQGQQQQAPRRASHTQAPRPQAKQAKPTIQLKSNFAF